MIPIDKRIWNLIDNQKCSIYKLKVKNISFAKFLYSWKMLSSRTKGLYGRIYNKNRSFIYKVYKSN